MKREDIIRMAREAGAMFDHMTWVERDLAPVFERFAALVAAHVRETEFKPDWNNYRQGLADGADEEREACAKVASGFYASDASNYPSHIAAAIRARGQA